jgi:hypothetical protein
MVDAYLFFPKFLFFCLYSGLYLIATETTVGQWTELPGETTTLLGVSLNIENMRQNSVRGEVPRRAGWTLDYPLNKFFLNSCKSPALCYIRPFRSFDRYHHSICTVLYVMHINVTLNHLLQI